MIFCAVKNFCRRVSVFSTYGPFFGVSSITDASVSYHRITTRFSLSLCLIYAFPSSRAVPRRSSRRPRFLLSFLFFFFHAGGARNSEAPGKSAARTLITGEATGLATPAAEAAATAAAALGAIARGTGV